MAIRRTFKPEFKARVVLQALTGSNTAVQVCRKSQFSEQLLASWKKQLPARADLLPGASRHSFSNKPGEGDGKELREPVNQFEEQFPTYGSRRLAAQLRRAP